MEYTHTEKEKLFLNETERVIEEWRKVMELDPIWEFPVDIIEEDLEGGKAAVNIAGAQYYRVAILLAEELFELDEEDFIAKLNDEIIPHELIHIVAVDFFRTALLLAGDNKQMAEELRYRYEQFVVRICKIITKLRNENLRLRYELARPNTGAEE